MLCFVYLGKDLDVWGVVIWVGVVGVFYDVLVGKFGFV